ncbi:MULTISPECIES: Lrp/AsnC family transcriptional regulator [unclassified Undibacterium]|uniref:Lrp/AsnC family transcriptional regulator n=1 Tax=unclassified Undibacterium TaxID=2630295 RepID=UPI002AC9928A|nr:MULTISPECIES: Lrp/AsnC family transcriptional regulator [unclassified Undibacterium]MEB0140858.1 Lrp/AsnC family transcriptional regulator [Undibacterium sp. CCC2.1]MEB0173830.1 Lrp/AsnC family transcriptional regulator [Undibacterium sp. CCC1.1]MEB0177811.1 Lrp/AsnC family transcriptional regulator [Undibacterium sp. CCC3.4]MEB0216693.1 Lrp/AsnC family transcriptional regulator [Undibacterium sp. 5I2]WPX44375.1 Lrp/AsnC family transcriptional regulator [Undibacterium sp. CCC3.4]
MDKKDLEILSLLQKDASIALSDLAQAVHLSVTPCWRRVQKLHEDGVIRQQVALCDPVALNLGLTVMVALKAARHNEQWMQQFISGVKDIAEIVEILRMSGELDYLLKVHVPDMAGFDIVYKKLVKVADLQDVSSSFVMEVIKSTTALPLHYAVLKAKAS